MIRSLSNSVFFLLLLASASTILSCKKESDIDTEPVVKTDTLIVVETDTLIVTNTDTLTLTDTVTLEQFIQDTITTFILVRHAETEGSGSNPNLSLSGDERAQELARALGNVPLAAVYSTNYNRTTQTAEPVADDQSLDVDIYDGFVLDPLIDSVLEDHWGKSVLVVGHSNTTPTLANKLLGEERFGQFGESEYDNLLVITVHEKGRSEVVHLKYGE